MNLRKFDKTNTQNLIGKQPPQVEFCILRHVAMFLAQAEEKGSDRSLNGAAAHAQASASIMKLGDLSDDSSSGAK